MTTTLPFPPGTKILLPDGQTFSIETNAKNPAEAVKNLLALDQLDDTTLRNVYEAAVRCGLQLTRHAKAHHGILYHCFNSNKKHGSQLTPPANPAPAKAAPGQTDRAGRPPQTHLSMAPPAKGKSQPPPAADEIKKAIKDIHAWAKTKRFKKGETIKTMTNAFNVINHPSVPITPEIGETLRLYFHRLGNPSKHP